MDAQTWLKSLPNTPGPERDKLVMDAVSSGLATINWLPVTCSIPGHTAIFQVCDDAMRVEMPDGSRFRFQVTAKMTQQCADLVGGSMVTAKIMDLSYQQATKSVDASILTAGAEMSSTNYSARWNTKVEVKRAKHVGLFRDCGKAWILDNSLAGSAGAVNYGFYAKNAIYTNPHGIKLWQNVGTRHNALHQDYSQTLFLMSKICEVDGTSMEVSDVMSDPVLANLINYSGKLKYTRQP
jgi:hypothetical protein